MFLESACSSVQPALPLPSCKSGVWGLAGSGSWGAAQPNSSALRASVPRAHSCHHSQPHAGDPDTPRPMFRTRAPSPAAGDALYQRVSSSLHGLLFPAVCSCQGLLAPSHNAARSAPLSSGPVLVPRAKDSRAFPRQHFTGLSSTSRQVCPPCATPTSGFILPPLSPPPPAPPLTGTFSPTSSTCRPRVLAAAQKDCPVPGEQGTVARMKEPSHPTRLEPRPSDTRIHDQMLSQDSLLGSSIMSYTKVSPNT